MTWLTALITLSPQMVGHFLFEKLPRSGMNRHLYQLLHPQTENQGSCVLFGVETSAQYLVESLANSLTWWYPMHGVRSLSLACQPGRAALPGKPMASCSSPLYLTPIRFYRSIRTLPP